ncbi:MAG: helix-turn-helix domain-containing protein [Nitriliruptoraceae bacterium]
MASGFLTTQQVQDLLDVDASTIYRMAGDGRLPAVRIGRQWRFPAAEIEAMLRPGHPRADAVVTEPTDGLQPGRARPAGLATAASAVVTPAAGASPARASALAGPASPVPTLPPPDEPPLSPVLTVAVLEAVAPALGVSMVVTDLDGRPLSPIVNPAPGIVARSRDPEFAVACSREWRGFANEPHLSPRLVPGRFGFLCAHSFVRRGPQLLAMVLAGGIAPPERDDPDLYHLDHHQHRLVLEALPRTAALLSQLVALTATSTEAP